MSDTDDGSESGRGPDTARGNWLTRNFWILKGLVAAGALVALAFASLAFFEGAMANVLWAMGITLAGLVVLIEGLFGGLQLAQSA
ncbi:hypothetical protein [Halorussus sp. AFM4]|uniref:hypothetical protein n=1 Tax=Halorussus sp. AFM4 TaxID=3421651 RepID=UPI003EB735A3